MCLKDTANTLNSKGDLILIERYKKLHAMGIVWPKTTAGTKEVGMDMDFGYKPLYDNGHKMN